VQIGGGRRSSVVTSRTNIMDLLARGERLLMDGGTGSELQRRGVDVLIGASAERLGAW
jgi:hypothetical protein